MEGGGGRDQSPELVRVKEENAEPDVHIKEEVEDKIEYSDESTALKEELCCPNSVETGELSCPNSTRCGVSEEAMLAGLYTNHEVKDELVLGPEQPHRPDVNLVVPSWAKADVDSSIPSVQESHRLKYALWDYCVRLQRDPHVEALANMRTKTQNTNTDNYMDSDADDKMYTTINSENELCDLCGESFTLKSDLLEHIMIHIYKPTKTEQEESVYGALENSFADVGACNPPDCSVRLERDPHVEALLVSIKHTTEHKDITTAYADSESSTKEEVYTKVEPHTEALANARTNPLDIANTVTDSDADDEMYTIIDCKKELCDLCGKTFALKSDLIDHAMIHIHVPTSTMLHQSRDTSAAQGQGSDNTQHKTHVNIVTDSETYVCDECGKTCQLKYELVRHIQNRHTRDPIMLKRRRSKNETYFCYICGKHYISKSYLKVHYRTHTGKRPYECDICQKRFATSSTLNTHKVIHNNSKASKLFSCDTCQKDFKILAHLKIHKRTHNVIKVKTFECKTCSKIFRKRGHLISHKRVHTGEKPYSCKLCDKLFTHRQSLKYHERKHTGEKPYQCKLCSKKFSRKDLLAMHERRVHSDDRPYRCEICDKRFKERNYLKIHKLVHTGEKPYMCYFCQKKYKSLRALEEHKLTHTGISCKICKESFTSLNKLNVHKRLHTGGNILTCGVCDKKFIDSCAFKVHKRTHTKRPFSCPQCDKRFSLTEDLKRHFQKHFGIRPFACKACGKRFTSKSSLTRHGRTHTGEKPYSCDFCNKQFSQSNTLNVHKQTHTGIKPYSCDVCNKRFSLKHHLTVHKRIHTGIKP